MMLQLILLAHMYVPSSGGHVDLIILLWTHHHNNDNVVEKSADCFESIVAKLLIRRLEEE